MSETQQLTLPLPGLNISVRSGSELALGGGLEGAQRTSRETENWRVATIPPDRAINTVKPQADARSKDMAINDGMTRGAVQSQMDSIVGSQYRLTAKINWALIPGATADWAREAQKIIETRFHAIAESDTPWLDNAGINTFTGQLRLCVASFMMTGEACISSEWDPAPGRPLKTCFQVFGPGRLANPGWQGDTKTLRRGVALDSRGKPTGYYIANDEPNSFWPGTTTPSQFKYVARYKPWGRPQILHILEQLFPDQHRGIADMVAALKHMKMTKNLQEVVLQNAVLNATYAAAIETEMPGAEMITAMGGDTSSPEALQNAIGAYLTGLSEYLGTASSIALDGVMIPHLYPGTKLNMKTLGTPGAVGTDFEKSLIRHTAAALNMDYAEFSKDYSQMSYATARMAAGTTRKFIRGRKKIVADRAARMMYSNILEEFIAQGEVPLPPGYTRDDYYKPLQREAWSRSSWIGTGIGQIDELKETQAAVMRVAAGLSSYETEIARLGEDWRDVYDQLAAESALRDQLGLTFDTSTSKLNTGQGGGPVTTGPEVD